MFTRDGHARLILLSACSFLPTSPFEYSLKAWVRFTYSFCPRIFCTLRRWQVLAWIVPSLQLVYIPYITLLTDGPQVAPSLNGYSPARKVCEVPCNKTYKHALKFWTCTLLVFQIAHPQQSLSLPSWISLSCPVARFWKVPKTFRARKAFPKTPTRSFCKAGLFICCKGEEN